MNIGHVVVCVIMVAGAASLAGCGGVSATDQTRAEFQESRRVAELTARIETLDAKLAVERKIASDASIRADLLGREIASLRDLRDQEKIQYDLAVKLVNDMKEKLETMRSEAATLKTLQEDVVRLNAIIKERDAELARLRAELDRQGRRADGTAP